MEESPWLVSWGAYRLFGRDIRASTRTPSRSPAASRPEWKPVLQGGPSTLALRALCGVCGFCRLQPYLKGSLTKSQRWGEEGWRRKDLIQPGTFSGLVLAPCVHSRCFIQS